MPSRRASAAWLISPPYAPAYGLSSARLVARDDDAGRGADGFRQPEVGGRALGEQAPARAEDERVDHQHVLVDQGALPQRLEELTAAQDEQIGPGLLLQRGHGGGRVPAQQ